MWTPFCNAFYEQVSFFQSVFLTKVKRLTSHKSKQVTQKKTALLSIVFNTHGSCEVRPLILVSEERCTEYL